MVGSILLSALLTATPGLARAVGDGNRVRAPATASGLLGADDSAALYPLDISLGARLSFARRPWVWRYPDNSFDPVVSRQLFLDLTATVGVVRLVDLGVALPVLLEQRGSAEAGFGELSGAGLGDLRLSPRLSLVHERSYGVGFALIPEVTFPTGDSDRLLGDDGVAFRPRAIVTLPIAALRLIGNVGYAFRPNRTIAQLEIVDELTFNLGVEYDLSTLGLPAEILMELAGATAAANPLATGGPTSLEILGALRLRIASDHVVTLGGGAGLTQGFGTPAYRLIAGFTWAPLSADTDRDGIPDRVDDCPALPEDYDAFADLDGCPDADNDGDDIPDSEDRCPLTPEDRNGVADDDGCPDSESTDQDRDGIPDELDDCPVEPEDFDDFEDEDGCPDVDHDHDGIPNDRDECPEQQETINGIDDDDGCPDEGAGVTFYVEQQRIEITAQVLFESGRATLKEASRPVLDQVALQILAHPEIPKIRVGGHTDSLGPDEDNLFLSQDRADAVRRYLIRRGIDKRRLEAVGYGESRPIDDNDTAEGRTRNRRVEFLILEKR